MSCRFELRENVQLLLVRSPGSEAVDQSKQRETAAAERVEAAAKRLEQISRLARQT